MGSTQVYKDCRWQGGERTKSVSAGGLFNAYFIPPGAWLRVLTSLSNHLGAGSQGRCPVRASCRTQGEGQTEPWDVQQGLSTLCTKQAGEAGISPLGPSPAGCHLLPCYSSLCFCPGQRTQQASACACKALSPLFSLPQTLLPQRHLCGLLPQFLHFLFK